jgi:autotransporter-associated beta strand protein
MKRYLLAGFLLLFIFTAVAANRTWDGGAAGADANWVSANNWTGNVAPSGGDFLIFPDLVPKQTVTNNFAANTDFSGFQLDANYTLRGNAVDLTNQVSISSTGAVIELTERLLANIVFGVSNSSDLLVSGAIQLNAHTLNFAVSGGPADVSGIISGTGASRVTKTGFGILRLLAANTYADLTSVGLGTLVVNGSITSDMEVQSLSTLAGVGSIGSTTNRGKLLPGDGGPGILTANGLFTFSSSAAMVVEIEGTTAGSGTINLSFLEPWILGTLTSALSATPPLSRQLAMCSRSSTKPAPGRLRAPFPGSLKAPLPMWPASLIKSRTSAAMATMLCSR